MTQYERDLLLQDLCARLPYKVMAQYYDPEDECETWDEIEGIESSGHVEIGQYVLPIENIKPYLYPMSSMTKEQKNEYNNLCETILDDLGYPASFNTVDSLDWLNKNRFDFRGLIPKGLAIDATDLNIISYERLHKTC